MSVWQLLDQPATAKQRKVLHTAFSVYNETPELVSNFSKFEAQTLIGIFIESGKSISKVNEETDLLTMNEALWI